MPSKKLLCLTSASVILCAAGCRSKSPVVMQEAISPANVNASRLINADQQPGNWMSYGRTYSEQRFSPLKQINDQNVGQLALACASRKPVWETLTIDPKYPYTITGAPPVVKGKVLIGNGGAEFGVRGYISAYDAATGKLAWRFYTVPGDPSKPFEA